MVRGEVYATSALLVTGFVVVVVVVVPGAERGLS